MLRALGRIILVVIGIAMIISAILFFVDFASDMSILFSNSFMDIFNVVELRNTFINFILRIVLALAALTAFYCGITGKCGLWFTIFAVFMLALFIFAIATEIRKDGGFNGPAIAGVCLNSISIIGYVVGFVFLNIGKDKE